MVFGCCVPRCSSRGKGIAYFRVPFTNAKRLEAWLAKCSFLKRYKTTQLENVRFCAAHFSPECINDKRRLSADAVPSLNLLADCADDEDLSNTTGTEQSTNLQQYLILTPSVTGKALEIKAARLPIDPKAKLVKETSTETPIKPSITTLEDEIAQSDVNLVVESHENIITTTAQSVSQSLAKFDSLDRDHMDVDDVDEQPDAMWDVRACRGCLAVKGKLEKISDGCKRLYTALTGLQIAEGDGYPHYFCLECRTVLKKCLAFRRKTRRAHYVMKEIMSVRKQVTYSDIITVNRKKTNLDSSLGFWEPQKTCSLVMKEDEDPQPDVPPRGPFNMRVVDIKPDVDTTEPTDVNPIDNIADIPNDMDNNDTEFNLKDELFDIDLNDVFKDLNNENDDDTAPSPEPVIDDDDAIKKEPGDTMSQKVNKFSIKSIVNALDMCDIKVLSLENQKKRMEIRKVRPPFVHALYKCAMCLTIHKSMPELVAHVAYHNSRRYSHECVVCRNKYPTVEDLNIHVARCHMYEYKCKCGIKRFSLHDIVKHCKSCEHERQKELAELKRARIQESPLKCFTIISLTQKMMHHARALRRPSPATPANATPEVITADDYKCDVCGEWLKLKKNLESHMTMKHRFLYTCNECKEVFTERGPAIIHGKTHRQAKTWNCEQCEGCFENLKALKFHRIKSHRTKTTCNLCGQLFNNTRAYYRHQLVEHNYISLNDPLVGDPQYKCVDCGIQFVDRRSLETHLVTMNHTGASEVEFACVPCKKIFENEEQLETHYVICGNTTKYPRKCCYCSETLLDKNHYKRHYVTQHPMLQYVYTTRNAICDICGKLVKRPQLEAHLRMHAGAAHCCRRCGAASASAAQHVAHVLCHHSARPYRCALCPRRFQHKGDCRDHILKVHAPAKLYKCEFCQQEFSYFRHLREHSEKLHNLVIPSLKNKSKKSKTKIFVYAHMKIEIDEQERDAVAKADIAMLDYLDHKSKPVDYKDYFIFSEQHEEIFRMQKRSHKRKEPVVPKIEIESDVIIKPRDEGYEEIETQIKMETSTEVEDAVRFIEQSEVKEEAQELALDEERPLEVFENDGTQFVMIGGELYRIACDDEVDEE